MAGHSQFKNIMHRKGAQDAKRAKMFNKLAREITVAAKMGAPDPATNPRLRNAIIAARGQNMPNDRISRAIKQGSGPGEGDQYEEIRYEGYGPGGVALIVEALSDNRNRTAAEVRSAFNKYGGALGETNSVSFMFDRVGVILFKNDIGDADTVFEAALEAGADNVETSPDGHEVTTSVETLASVRDMLVEKFGDPERAALIWKPQNLIAPNEEQAANLMKMLDVLEDNDDVQHVYANFDIPEDMLEKLAS